MEPKRKIAFVLAATDHGTMIVNKNDYATIGESSYGVCYEIFENSSFSAVEIGNAIFLLNKRREHFGNGVVALDCGANIGVHTVEWAKKMHSWGNVIAIEAQERIFYSLAGNLAINNCFNARALWSAVGSTIGNIGVPIPDYNIASSYGSLELIEKQNNEFIGQNINYNKDKLFDTKLITIDSLNLERLDFIKLDIEGMEMDALIGSEKTIRKHKPIMMIEHVKSDIYQLKDFLKTHLYSYAVIGMNMICIHESDPTCSVIDNIKTVE